jgi:hypothetical protein
MRVVPQFTTEVAKPCNAAMLLLVICRLLASVTGSEGAGCGGRTADVHMHASVRMVVKSGEWWR